MAGNNGRPRKFVPSPTGDALNLRPCLLHVPSGEMITSYMQLSRIVRKLGWKVFIDVTGNTWSAWDLPAGEACFLQMVFLPHPHMSSATYYQLSTVVQALGVNTFTISYAPLRKFREMEAYTDMNKPGLRVRATGREVFTIQGLVHVLNQHGWKQEGESQFVKHDSNERGALQPPTVIKIPDVINVHQLSTLDLEYITLVTDNVFYLQHGGRSVPPRKQMEMLKTPPRRPVLTFPKVRDTFFRPVQTPTAPQGVILGSITPDLQSS